MAQLSCANVSSPPMSDFDFRFGGIGRLFGTDALARLRAAHVCVVGIGGVGSWAVEASRAPVWAISRSSISTRSVSAMSIVSFML